MAWLHEHAPRTLSEVALAVANRRLFESYLAHRTLPRDLVLTGEAGRGKSTVAAILEDALAFDALAMNASGERGVDVVRGEITGFIRAAQARRSSTRPDAPYRILRLDEAHLLRHDALTELRKVVDQRPEWVRLVLTCNQLPADKAFVDRFRVIEFGPIPVTEQVKVIERLLAAEGLTADPEVTLACTKAAPSMRWLIDYVEQSFLEHGRLVAPPSRALRVKQGNHPPSDSIGLLVAVIAIVADSPKRRLFTRDILHAIPPELVAANPELDPHLHVGPSVKPSQALARAGTALSKAIGVRSKTITEPGPVSAHGYYLTDLEKRLAEIQGRK